MAYQFLSTILGSNANFTGNVGVGTTTPATKLDVVGNVQSSGDFLFSAYNRSFASSSYPALYLYSSNIKSTQNIYSAGGTNGLSFYNNGSSLQFRIFDNGNVTVNSATDAGYKLDVNGTTRFQGSSLVTVGASTSAASLFNVNITQTGPNALSTTPKGIVVSGTYTDTNTGNNTVFTSLLSVEAAITSTTSTFSGAARSLINLSPSMSSVGSDLNTSTKVVDVSPSFTFRNVNNITGFYYNPTFTLSGSNNTHRAIETVSGDVYFASTSGNVGIGTVPTSTYKLDVNGTARVGSASVVANLRVSSSGRSDFYMLSGGSTTDNFSIYLNGGAYGSSYAQMGLNDGVSSGNQGGAVYFDSRTGTAPPIRFQVKGTGTTAMTTAGSIYPTANWGIGTTTDAGQKLQIAGNQAITYASTGESLTISRTGTYVSTPLSSLVTITDTTSNANQVKTGLYVNVANASTNIAIQTVGSVGVGATPPQNSFSFVSGYFSYLLAGATANSAANYNINARSTVSSYAAGNGGGISFWGDDRGQAGANTAFAGVRGVKENSTYLNGLGALVFLTQASSAGLSTESTFAEVGRFTSGGNFLIGTTTDAGYKLQVNGTAIFYGSPTISVSNLPQLTLNDTLQNHNWIIRSNGTSLFFIDNGNNRVWIGGTGSGNAGNVGIGTTSTSYKLDVNGTARVVTSLRVGADGNTYTSIDNGSFNISRISDGGNGIVSIQGPTVLNANRNIGRFNGREGVQLSYDTAGRLQVFQTTTTIGLGANDTSLTNDTSTILRLDGSKTASSAIARGANFVPTLVAAANNDVLVGLDIAPTFTNGAFTGLSNWSLRVNSGASSFGGDVALNGNRLYIGSIFGNTVLRPISTTSLQLFNANAGAGLFLDANGYVQIGQSNAVYWAYFSATGHIIYGTTNTNFFTSGNVGINQGTDAGYKLDVGGTTRFQGNITQSSGSATFANGILLDSTSRIFSSSTITYQSNNASSQHLFKNDISSALSGTIVTISNSSGAFGTTSASNFLNITGRLATASGTNNLTSILLNHTVENTGTYTGTIRGIYYNPSNIIGTGFTHRAIETVTGDIYFASTSGNVGIGTAPTSSYKLDVNGLIRTNRTSNTDGGLVFGTVGTYLYGADSGGYLATYTSNTERMRVTSSGQVGIGTTSPSGLLDVSTGSVNITSYAYGLDLKLSLGGGFARANRIYNSLAPGLTSFFGAFGDSTSGVTRAYWTIGNQTDDTGFSYTSGIHLLYNGNVGVGTSTPTEKLSVNGNIALPKSGNTFIYNDQSGADSITIGGASYFSVKTFNGANYTEVFRATATNNLLIGTTTDNGYRLQVSGRASVYTGATVTDSVALTVADGSNGLNYIPYVGTGSYNNLSYGGGSLLFNNISSRLTVGTHNGTAIQFGPSDTLISGAITLYSLAGSGTRMVVADASGVLSTQAIPGGGSSFGAFQEDTTQTAPSSNTGYGVKFSIPDISGYGVSVINDPFGDATYILMSNSGVYNIQFSLQLQNTSGQIEDVTIWLRKNGNTTADDIPATAGFVSVPNSHGGTPGTIIAAWNYFVQASAGDFFQLAWSTTDHTRVTIEFYPAGFPPPSAASAILTVNKVN
jgi:hypothetical protein